MFCAVVAHPGIAACIARHLRPVQDTGQGTAKLAKGLMGQLEVVQAEGRGVHNHKDGVHVAAHCDSRTAHSRRSVQDHVR